MDEIGQGNTFRVAKARPEDIDRGIARIGTVMAEQCDLHEGDIVTIQNLNTAATTVARIFIGDFSGDEGDSLAIDGTTRHNAKLALGEWARVQIAKYEQAESVMLNPLGLNLSRSEVQQLARWALDRPVMQGDIISCMIMGTRSEFEVAEVQPRSDIVVITAETAITFENPRATLESLREPGETFSQTTERILNEKANRSKSTSAPEGRLYQVAYALEAIRRGNLVTGAKCPEGAVLVTPKSRDQRWIYPLDDHVGCIVIGSPADGRVLVDQAQAKAQDFRSTYGEPASLHVLFGYLAGQMQRQTLLATTRPLGCSLAAIAVDAGGPELMTLGPGGTFQSWDATAIGTRESSARDFLDANYAPDLGMQDIAVLASNALLVALEGISDKNELAIALVRAKEKEFQVMTPEELQQVIDAL